MIRELDFLEYADLLDYLQDEDELADEYDVAINHTILLNTYIKSRRYKREPKVKGRRISRLAKPLTRRSVKNEKVKKKDGVIRPFLLATNEVGGGLGFPQRTRRHMQCVYKCALRFSKGIEPRRAHVSLGQPQKYKCVTFGKSNKK